MFQSRLYSIVGIALTLIGTAALMLVPSCGSSSNVGDSQGPGSAAYDQSNKHVIAGAPAQAKLGQIYHSKIDGRDYIYDGVRWVPHDNSIDDPIWQERPAVMRTTFVQPPATATGAHAKHDAFTYANNCKICHMVGGVVCFDPAGPAVAAGQLAPVFDSTAKSCSNISCHGFYSGTFSYYFWNGDDAEFKTYAYAGNGTTPSWYTTGAGCTGCHGNPPRPAVSTPVWHSGRHGSIDINAATNQCQTCHPDATGSGGAGTAITNPSLHANGTVNVQAQFRSSCFGCH
jgi:predicted CxxxxCH...CXXCH cytochrome family protein